MAAAAGVEPATCSLGESRSIQLSYATAFYLCRKNRTNIRNGQFLTWPSDSTFSTIASQGRFTFVFGQVYTIAPFQQKSSGNPKNEGYH